MAESRRSSRERGKSDRIDAIAFARAAMAAARSNRVFVACCDRTGTERGQEWTAGTTIINQSGWPLATADQDGIAVADVGLSLAREKRFTELADAMADRRPDLYTAMAAALTDAQPVGQVVGPAAHRPDEPAGS